MTDGYAHSADVPVAAPPRSLRLEKLEDQLREMAERIARLEWMIRETLGVEL